MPVALTYPGVYIEEIPSGVRPIVGVPTAITAFVGRAQRGPTNTAVTINSFGDFERIFGGMWLHSRLGYAVRDYFLNGGAQAVLVRLFGKEQDTELGPDGQPKPKVDADGNPVFKPTNATLTLPTSDANKTLTLEAAWEGSWGNSLRARVDALVNRDPEFARGLGPTPDAIIPDDLFNLTVVDMATGTQETFRNLTVKPSIRQVNGVLEGSRLVHTAGTLPDVKPVDTDAELLKDAAGSDQTKKDKAVKELAIPPFTSSDERRSVGVSLTVGDGKDLTDAEFSTGPGLQANKHGIYALLLVDTFNLLCIPPYKSTDNVDTQVLIDAAALCQSRRAMLIVDSPPGWTNKQIAHDKMPFPTGLGAFNKNAAIFFPRLLQPNPLSSDQVEEFVPCGAVAGVMARTDRDRGVWKAPAGLDASLAGVPALTVNLTDDENGELNPLGLNCLRMRPAVGFVIWGARTLAGDDRLASEWKYTPIRRLALFIEESLYRGTQWVVFEPNDEPLWAQIRLNVGAFMRTLFDRGAFEGRTPTEAFFVKCDKDTNPQAKIDLGIVTVVVGFAPLKPAEFVVIQIQQMAGQIAT